MKRGLLSVVAAFGFGVAAYAQLAVTENNDGAVVLGLSGPGVTISNVVVDCPGGAMGTFNGVSSNLLMNSGVLLTTGKVLNAPGPDSDEGDAPLFGSNNGAPGDADLVAALGLTNNPGLVRDACVVTFQLTSSFSPVTFNYVFASEEYNEYVGSEFNDAFALFVKGPGLPPGWTNLAKIPGTDQFVSINNVNLNANSNYYTNNDFGSSIQYDGFTKVMAASVNVTPGAVYQFKFVIADLKDRLYDSGVFIDLLRSQPMPIVMQSLKAEYQSEGVALSWRALSENPAQTGYYVERSENGGVSFERLKDFRAKAAPGCTADYFYLDASVKPNRRYIYRITEFSTDEKIIDGYSENVEIFTGTKYETPIARLFPSPTDGALYLTHSFTQPISLNIIDMLGRKVAEFTPPPASDLNTNVDLSASVAPLIKGVYTLEIQTPTERRFIKFIKQ